MFVMDTSGDRGDREIEQEPLAARCGVSERTEETSQSIGLARSRSIIRLEDVKKGASLNQVQTRSWPGSDGKEEWGVFSNLVLRSLKVWKADMDGAGDVLAFRHPKKRREYDLGKSCHADLLLGAVDRKRG